MSAPERLPARGQIVSLWDMLERHALLFVEAIQWMSDAKALASTTSFDAIGSDAGKREVIIQATDRLKRACILSDLDVMLPSLERLLNNTRRDSPFPSMDLSSLAQEMRSIISLLKDHLQNEFYFHLDGADVPLFIGTEPFGTLVAKKFPKAIEDIAEAGKCLATQRSTACVFHLMRVMELGVRALQKKLKVTIADPRNETWNHITDQTNKAINTLPTKTRDQQKRKQKLAVAIAHLNAVRIAWRNEVMHSKQTYTREEAHDVYRATRLFMMDLSSLV